MWKLAVCLSLFAGVCSTVLPQTEDGTVTVKIQEGLLRGKIITSIWKRTYHSFRGVPYAQPPIGDLRFKAPRPVKPWTGVKEATELGTYCPQTSPDTTNATMSEDCLYLNVYVPQVPAASIPAAGMPVLFWVHGGGFVEGSGAGDSFRPDNFMNHSVILVSINYRLGVLGNLYMEHPDVTSNAGMKDTVAALRWVKRNIANFGGNPDNVTIFGQSAGGASIEYLLLSAMTAGLFQRGISESGSAMMYNRDTSNTQDAFILGKTLGYNGTDVGDLVKHLRSVTVEDIIKGYSLAVTKVTSLASYQVVDSKTQDGSEVFLTDTPENLIRAGKSHSLPYITGVNSQEAKWAATGLTQASLNKYNNDPEQLIPSFMHAKKGTDASRELASKIKTFYFGNKTISLDTLVQFVTLQSDSMIYPSHRSAMLHARYGTSPVYPYLFTYDGTMTSSSTSQAVKGPGHTEELSYLFYPKQTTKKPSSDDWKVMKHFMGMWVDFAQAGNPSLHETVKWTPASKTNLTCLQIDVELSLHQDFLKERMAFWDNMYGTY